MTTIDISGASADHRGPRLSPSAVRRTTFPRAPLGRRGLLEADVERFRDRVADELARSDAAKADLRAENGRLQGEVQRLHDYFRDRRIDPELIGMGAGPSTGSSTAVSVRAGLEVQAVNMMSLAQQAADQHIAQAEQYARQLIGDARRQYEQILLMAHRQAEEAAAAAAAMYQQTTPVENRSEAAAELSTRVAYLRTFADVTQVQMRSILDALRRELDQLSGPGSARAPVAVADRWAGDAPSGSAGPRTLAAPQPAHRSG
jgi:vacuolar-type H+-ATPase subunit H